MPKQRIPLVGSFNPRGIAGNASLAVPEDQRFLNCVFSVVQNPVTGKQAAYMERRPGWGVDSVVASGQASTGLCKPQSFNATLSAFGSTDSTIYFGTSSVGTISGRGIHFTETLVSSVGHVMIRSSDGTGWYYADGAKDITAYTADGNNSTTITDIKVAGVNSVSGLYVGQKLTAATNIAAGSRIVSINSGAFSAVLDTATTGGAFNDLAITKEPIAKIVDTDFITTGTFISAFSAMDGYLFYTTDDGNLRNSDLNSVTSYSSTGTIPVQMSADQPVGTAIQNNCVVALGLGSKEVFQNAGLASGSPLQRVTQPFQRVGCVDQRSVTQLEDTIWFVSTPYEGDIGVYRMQALSAGKISTAAIDKIMGTVSSNAAIYASSFKLGGYPYAAFAISIASDGPASMLLLESGDSMLLESGDDILLEDTPSQTAAYVRTLVVNSQLNVWSEWDCDEMTFVDGLSTGTANSLVATSRMKTDGKVYTINPSANGEIYQDDGSTYTCQVRTARIDFGTPIRKFVKRITLIGDKQAAGTVTVEKSDDDYETWQTLGTFDLTSMKPEITRCGSHRGGRAYRLSHSYNGPWRAEALEIEYELAATDAR